ncbi:MAG: hypothetical protein R3F59_36165 [Myxococcota bacterium]
MELPGPKARSVTREGEDDGFVVAPGWSAQMTPDGQTRIVVSVPLADLPRVHAALATALAPPVSLLYRQKVDRRAPRPQGAPPRDFVGVGLALDPVLAALERAALLVYADARCEVWMRGALGEQLVLDEDGVLYAYPDDPAFRDALGEAGVPPDDVESVGDRDYVRHEFRAEADALEDQLVAELHLVQHQAPRG